MSVSRKFCAAALAAILTGGPSTAAAAESLVYTGDLPATAGFMRDLAVLFEAQTGIKTELRISDTSTAIRATARGESDLGGTTRPALADPREAGVALFPIAWDALAIIVHPDNPLDNITLAQLKAVVAGKLNNWQSLGGADRPINLHLPADPLSGLGYNVNAQLPHASNGGVGAVRADPDIRALHAAVASDPGALGVTSLTSVRGQPVKILSLEGIAPSPEALVAGDYLLFQPLQLAVRETSGAAERFVRFAQSPVARRILRRNGAVPYMDGLNLVGHQFDRENALRRAAQP